MTLFWEHTSNEKLEFMLFFSPNHLHPEEKGFKYEVYNGYNKSTDRTMQNSFVVMAGECLHVHACMLCVCVCVCVSASGSPFCPALRRVNPPVGLTVHTSSTCLHLPLPGLPVQNFLRYGVFC